MPLKDLNVLSQLGVVGAVVFMGCVVAYFAVEVLVPKIRKTNGHYNNHLLREISKDVKTILRMLKVNE